MFYASIFLVLPCEFLAHESLDDTLMSPVFCQDAWWESLPTRGAIRARSCCQSYRNVAGDGPNWSPAFARISWSSESKTCRGNGSPEKCSAAATGECSQRSASSAVTERWPCFLMLRLVFEWYYLVVIVNNQHFWMSGFAYDSDVNFEFWFLWTVVCFSWLNLCSGHLYLYAWILFFSPWMLAFHHVFLVVPSIFFFLPIYRCVLLFSWFVLTMMRSLVGISFHNKYTFVNL